MSDQVKVVLDGAKEAQQANLRTMSQLSPSGRGGRAVFYMISDLWAYAVRITHRDTTALALSHRMQVKGNRGEVYLDPDAQNPRPQGPRQTKPHPTPAVYGVHEHNRGGDHAFYDRTIGERGSDSLDRAMQYLAAGVE
jgi:hypothetical protein